MAIRVYEGAHVLVLDDPNDITATVLVRQTQQNNRYTAPGFGLPKDGDIEQAAIDYTAEQTGLKIGDLELYDTRDNGGKPFTEPDGTVQYVMLKRFIAGEVEGDVRKIVEEHTRTKAGEKFEPRVVDLEAVREMQGRDEIDRYTPAWLEELELI